MLAVGADVAVDGGFICEPVLEIRPLDAGVIAFRHYEYIAAVVTRSKVCRSMVSAVRQSDWYVSCGHLLGFFPSEELVEQNLPLSL